MNLSVQLGLAKQTESGVEIVDKKPKNLTSKEIQNFENHRANFIELCWLKFEQDDTIRRCTLNITYNDQGESPISNWFNTAGADTASLLFGKTLKNAKGFVGNFFKPWELKFVSFTNPTKKFKRDPEVIEIDDIDDVIEAKDVGTYWNHICSSSH